MKYSTAFHQLSQVDRANFEDALPVRRTPDQEPGSALGYWVSDRTYGAGGISAARQSFRSLA
jgi:hypothetical protein